MQNIFSIFNRNLSWRRRFWLLPSRKRVNIIKGRYGNDYYNDLRSAEIAINIHYSRKNLDDFESGIFEAMASGCLVVSEKLNKLIPDHPFININSANIYTKIKDLLASPQRILDYKRKGNKWVKKHHDINNTTNELYNFYKKYNLIK